MTFAMRPWVRSLWLPVVAVVFCAPLFVGLGGIDQDNDEAIYSYAVESILETGDWLNPRVAPNPDAVFLEKPPLKFWIVALPIRLGLLPDNDFGLRFFDALFGSLAFLYVFSIGRRMAGWICGVVALLMLYSFDSLIFAHGLRGNNMEAPLVLAYAGAAYHFLRWAETKDARAAARHAFAVGLYFVLGFMTKFVAALFLPVVLGAAVLEFASARNKALREWRTWVLVACLVLVLTVPWFVYQATQPDRELWQVMLGEHVYQRFNAWLDPAHLKPWSYYFTDLFDQMTGARTLWIILAGGLLLHARVLRERWLEGTLALYWFWLPFVLMSLGTSKLRHYTYPFLPPVALAGGYLVASVAHLIDSVVCGRPPAWMSRLALKAGIGRAGALAWPGRWMARVGVLLVLAMLLPTPGYWSALNRLAVVHHPLLTSRNCVQAVQQAERAAGRPAPGVYVFLPGHTYGHPYFFYYRTLGWDRHDGLTDDELMNMLDAPGQQRPVMLPRDQFLAAHAAHDGPAAPPRSFVQLNDIVILMPGPYARCGR